MSWEKGQKFEQLVENYLKKHNYLILERNWHAGLYGEIDLICLKEQILVFVEVRGRLSRQAHMDALVSINKTKIKKIYKSIQIYLQKIEQEKIISFDNLRFDIVTVSQNSLKHFENISLFDYL